MAINKKTFDSTGGFSVENTTIVTSEKDLTNVNTFELKNTNFSNSSTTSYILRSVNNGELDLDGIGGRILLDNNSLNFITGYLLGTNPDGTNVLSLKVESTVTCNSSGDVVVLSSLTTVIKDSVPLNQTWSILPYDGGAVNRFTYIASREGTTDAIRWFAHVQVSKVDWA
jgi:hypothetical protein